jgi:hypothetical protein
VFENRVLRKIFGPKRDEVSGWWRKLHNKELCDLYFFAKYNWNHEVEEDDVGGAFRVNGGEEGRT